VTIISQIVLSCQLRVMVFSISKVLGVNLHLVMIHSLMSFVNPSRITTLKIGGGMTCGTTRDPTNTMRSRWCLNEDGPDTSTSNSVLIGTDASNRLKGDSKCSQTMLSNKYDDTWVKYCKAKPEGFTLYMLQYEKQCVWSTPPSSWVYVL